MDYKARLNRVIPGGSHTYSRGFDQYPDNAPQILERGKGAYVWDANGKCYLDYGMALRAVTLGYAYSSVNTAAMREIEKGNNLTRPSITELHAAELLIDIIPSAEMVKFCKNGSNATTAAVKIARAYTEKRYICIPRQHPFFSFDDWFIGTTPIKRGIPNEHVSLTLSFDYGDIKSLEYLFQQYPDQIAGVMLEPATTQVPCAVKCDSELSFEKSCVQCPYNKESFLHQVQHLCKVNGALFILDEMITGFRWHLQGAQSYFDVKPDLSTFGKGMANGFSVAAVTGRREVMEVGAIDKPGYERTFLLSTTHGAEMCGLGAFIETVRVYHEQNVCQHLWCYGEELKNGLLKLAKDYEIQDYFIIDGPGISMNYITRDSNKQPSLLFRTLFAHEMMNRGIIIPWISISLAHKKIELEITLEAAQSALIVYRNALNNGIEKYLQSSTIKPVFRKYN